MTMLRPNTRTEDLRVRRRAWRSFKSAAGPEGAADQRAEAGNQAGHRRSQAGAVVGQELAAMAWIGATRLA